MPEVKEDQIWQHYKGNKYVVLCIAHEADLGVDFVIHKGLHDGRTWARSMQNFLGNKDENTPRFTQQLS